MVLTPEDVRNKRFSVVRFRPGYDEEEVDAFLDEIETELRRLLADQADRPGGPQPLTVPAGPTTAGPAAVPTPPPPPPAPEPPPPAAAAEGPAVGADGGHEAALRTLMLAQRTADEAIAQARSEAEEILAGARAQAADLQRRAQEEHTQRLSALQRERETLQSQVERLRVFEREYRDGLRTHLQQRLRELEGTPALAPPGDPVGGGAPSREEPATPFTAADLPVGPPREAGGDGPVAGEDLPG